MFCSVSQAEERVPTAGVFSLTFEQSQNTTQLTFMTDKSDRIIQINKRLNRR